MSDEKTGQQQSRQDGEGVQAVPTNPFASAGIRPAKSGGRQFVPSAEPIQPPGGPTTK